jgi:phosphoglycerate dehydrogenase-like enzyme
VQILSTVKLPNHLKEELSQSFPNITFHHDKKINEASDLLPEAEVIITYGEDLTEDHIKAADNLKWIMVASAGIDRLPFSILEERNITITNSKGVHAIPIAEYCISMMLQVSRQAEVLIENQKQRNWNRRVKMEELYGKTVLIIGTGAIGTQTAKLCEVFGMKVLGVNSNGRKVDHFDKAYKMDEISIPLSEADFVISVLPSTEKTKGLLNKDFFCKMKQDSVFINIGRGDVVVENDLIPLLNENRIKHAVLDVFEKEPLAEDHPFWGMDNVTVTPHLSGITKNYLPRVMVIFHRNLQYYCNHQLTSMENIIALEKRY